MTIPIQSIDQIKEAARKFVLQMGNNRVLFRSENVLPGHHIVAFYGKMGAGKTTFIKAVCETLGVEEVVTSPTFAIINEYQTASVSGEGKNTVIPSQLAGIPVYHFDFYRIKRLEEVYDMGYEDYFYHPRALCFIEWPELIEELLPDNTVRVTISENPDGTRTVETD